jgi:DNA-directed RNA polymerase specialized sigma24 family protein
MDMSSRPALTPGGGRAGGPAGATGADSDATAGVTALYQAHAVGLIRLAIVMLGDRGAAEDVVQPVPAAAAEAVGGGQGWPRSPPRSRSWPSPSR